MPSTILHNMQDKLTTSEYRDFNHMVDQAIFVEHKMNKLEAKKCKRTMQPPMSGSMKRARSGLPTAVHAPGSTLPQPMWMVCRPIPTAFNAPRPPTIQGAGTGIGPWGNMDIFLEHIRLQGMEWGVTPGFKDKLNAFVCVLRIQVSHIR